jgi:large subunit ribosomal protein L9
MKVILRSDITNVGRQGEVKDVACGFARNYLVPKNLAMEATDRNLKIWQREKVKLAKQREDIINKAKEVASKMETIEFKIQAKIGENGKIFGSITATNLSKLFIEQGFDVNKKAILLSENIRELGNYEINVRLHPEVVVKVKLVVLGEK